MPKLKNRLLISVVLLSTLVLGLSLRGLSGNPTPIQLQNIFWREDGPFELSPERGRFALAYSLIEEHSVYFPVDIARFVIPDLGYFAGHYVSLFAPATSFIVAPGYYLGRLLGISQVGTFAVISLFAIFNLILIYFTCISLKAGKFASLMAGLLFVFATPAYTYGVNLYQHHITAFLILLSIYLIIKYNSLRSTLLGFFLFALGVTVDYPNFFMMLPILIYLCLRLISVSQIGSIIKTHVNLKYFIALLGIVLPLVFFLWFNKASYGSPTNLLGGSGITSVKDIDNKGNPTLPKAVASTVLTNKSTSKETVTRLSNFNSRDLLNGLYILLLSPDRGMLYFTPVMFFGVIGFIILYQKHYPYLNLLAGTYLMNLLLYSMWGDPWGGWAFGARYLIPGYAIASIFIGVYLSNMKRNFIILPFFIITAIYSLGVNTLGAVTSNANPPKVEVLSLEKQTGLIQKYTWARNWDFLHNSGSKSYFYTAYGSHFISPVVFYWLLVGLLFTEFTYLAARLVFDKHGN